MANNIEKIDKLPPQNVEAEQSLLGSLLIDKDAIIKIADILTAEDFYKESHREIFETILELYSKHDPIDFLTITNLLDEKKILDRIGGRSYLMTLSNAVPTSSHVVNYANIVRKKATLRKLITAGNEIISLSYNEEGNIEEILDRSEQKLFGVSQKFLKQVFMPVRDILDAAFERIDELHRNSGMLRGVPTGFHDLDNILGGLQKSDLIVLAARPSVGKTSLALDIARQAAILHKKIVGVFSLEMSKEQLVDRLLCAEAGVDLWKLRTGKLSDREEDGDFPRIGHAMGNLAESSLYIDDTAGANIMEIRTKARRLHSEKGLDLLVIDYLQLMESSSAGENRNQEISQISRALKSIARELNIPVIALSQLARAVEMSKPAIPKLAHLRESGAIEQDADVVMFIYRKSADKNYREEEIAPEERNIAEIHIAKHRNGPTGVVKLFWNQTRASFGNIEKNMMLEEGPMISNRLPPGFAGSLPEVNMPPPDFNSPPPGF